VLDTESQKLNFMEIAGHARNDEMGLFSIPEQVYFNSSTNFTKNACIY